MRVAVVGATGLIGSRLCAALVERGDAVTAISRGGSAGIVGAEDARWDPAEGPPPPDALADADALVNLAGAPIAGKRWSADRKRLLHESRVATTRALVDALAPEGRPRTLVNASGIDYYGTPEERPAVEGDPPGTTFLAGLCVAWEREAARATEHGVRVAMIRSGIVLAADGGALPQLALPVKLFAGGPIGGGRQWLPWIHIDDEVGLILLALDDDRLAGPLNGVGPHPARQGDFVQVLGTVLGRPSLLPTPAIALRLGMGEMSTIALDSRNALPAAALHAGYSFAHPDLEPALRQIYG